MPRLEVRLLGPFETILDGQPLGFTYDKVRALLAFLCVEAGRPVIRERVAGMLWPDQPQNTAQDSLRQALYSLRNTLGDKENETSFLLVNRDRLQINLSSRIWIDLRNFEDLLARSAGHRHRALPGCPVCFNWLREAASLYRGSFLANLSLPENDLFEDWRAVRRERFERQLVQVLDSLISAAEVQGRDDLVLDWANRVVEIDPYHEPAHRRIIQALARSGRRSQAAAHYQRLQSRFQDDLGLAPSPETQALERAIHTGESLDSSLRQVCGLPSPANPLVGRTVECSELETWLSDPARRLITIVGPAGIGKTRLVIETARRLAPAFADGGVYLSFSKKMVPGTLPSMLVNFFGTPALGLSEIPSKKDLLVVLDGCEYILQDREAVCALLEAAPHLVVLAASRERFGVPGEWIFGLGGLEVPPPGMNERMEAYSAVALFEQSARQVWAGFCLTPENRSAVGEICRLVGGNPLALQLAAAWVRVIPLTEIAAQIRNSLDLLAAAPAGSSDPHTSVRVAFEQSWQRLEQREQSAFMRLSVFQDGFDRAAAFQVAGASFETLARLIDTSFLRVSSQNRYELHDLLQQFGAEKLVQSGEEEATRQDHFSYFLNLARQNEANFHGPEALKAFLWLSHESANLQSALAWAEQHAADKAGPFAELTHLGIHQTGFHQIN